MSVSLSTAVGRCDGSGGALSVRHHLFKGATSNGLELLDRLENTALGRGVSVEDWLDDHPAIREAIQWEHTGFLWLFPASTSYAFWPAEDKETLQELVDAYAACELQTFADPPTNQLDLEDEDAVGVELSASTAKRRFMAHVAHSLAVEMGEWVPWSLTDYDENELAFLLDSRNLFTWKIFGNYEIEFDKHAPAVSARPRFTYEFLFENDLIGYDRLDTIARVINWCRWNMRHFSAHRNDDDEPVGGDYSVLSMDLHWQYRGSGQLDWRLPWDRRVSSGCAQNNQHTGEIPQAV